MNGLTGQPGSERCPEAGQRLCCKGRIEMFSTFTRCVSRPPTRRHPGTPRRLSLEENHGSVKRTFRQHPIHRP